MSNAVVRQAGRRGAGFPRARLLALSLAFILGGALTYSPAHAHGSADSRLARVNSRIAQDPANPHLHAERAGILLDSGHWSDAEAAYGIVETLDPDLPELLLGRSLLFLETGRDEKALEDVDRLVAMEPQLAEGHHQRGRILLGLGRSSEAREALTTAVRLDPAPRPEDFLELAALLPKGQTALDVLDEGRTRLGPSVALELAAIEIEQSLGRWDRALSRVSSLERFYARQEPLLELRSRILLESGAMEEARASLLELIRILRRRDVEGRSAPADRECEARAHILLDRCAAGATNDPTKATRPQVEP